MQKNVLLSFFAVLFMMSPTYAQVSQPLSPEKERALQSRYPKKWAVQIPTGSALDTLIKNVYSHRLQKITERDIEDESPFPLWYRAYLRENLQDLPTAGPYQYPRVAQQILEWMVAHPNLQVPPPFSQRMKLKSQALESRSVEIPGTNINLTNFDERNSESFIAIDYANPSHLTAASNNITGSGRQKQFFSADSGATWTSTELPLAPGVAFHSDPALAWTTDGTAWAATLGINNLGSVIKVQMYKSTDQGATWQFVDTISQGNNNDKELMWIDTHPSSPHKDHIYVAYDVTGGGMRFVRSIDKGQTWSLVMTLSTDGAIGTHLTTGPSGELYVAWPDTTSRELRVRKSTDGGATFDPTNVIATTNDSFEVSIPAMCDRKVLIYLSIGVDRTDSPRKGWVYATWTDRNGTTPDPGCNGGTSSSNTNIYFSRSKDGGATWSTPEIIHSNPDKTDQFNQWMDVDQDDNGKIHVMYYDTRDDTGRKKTHVYYIASKDGGNTWVDEQKVTTAQTDETVAGADCCPQGNQYGDYNGLVAYKKKAYPVWTDRRSGVPGEKEQIFSTEVKEPCLPPQCNGGEVSGNFEYAAKIVCGLQKDPEDMRLARGFYATAVNIHNPGKKSVKFLKKLALTFPPEEQKPGKVMKIAVDLLKSNEALAVDCTDIKQRLFPTGFPTPYIKGFVVIQSTGQLDVSAVYSTGRLNTVGQVTEHSSMDVEQIKERRIKKQ